MDSVNKTLYIPLYGKAYVSSRGLFLKDEQAQKMWEHEGFDLPKKARSKYLAYYMGIRAALFDEWLRAMMDKFPEAAVLHVGCGLDSRILRVGCRGRKWYDMDFPDVIRERRKWFYEDGNYSMIPGDIRALPCFMESDQRKDLIVVMEGVSMYLNPEEMKCFAQKLESCFSRVHFLMDAYTPLAAKMSRIKNPVKEVGVTSVYGLEDPRDVEGRELRFVREHEMTPKHYIDELQGMEKLIFQRLYAGSMSKKLYRLYEYEKL